MVMEKLKRMKDMDFPRLILIGVLFCIQLIWIILFVVFVDYDTVPERKHIIKPAYVPIGSRFDNQLPHENKNPRSYANLTAFVFIGIGFLHATLRNYAFTSLLTTLLLGTMSFQFGILLSGVFHHLETGKIILNINTFVFADYLTTACLIAVSCGIGTVSIFHLLFIMISGALLFTVNEHVTKTLLRAVDIGGSIYIHVFGAFYGLAATRFLSPSIDIHSAYRTLKKRISKRNGLFSLLGTFSLFVYWPNYNAILSTNEFEQMRTIYNTILALCGSVSCTFIVSIIMSDDSKVALVHIQHATLAGGVAVGAVANLMIRPFGALMVGCFAGTFSTIAYTNLTPYLEEKLRLHDSCGVLALHGIPGMLGGFFSSLVSLAATEFDYGPRFYTIFPAMAPKVRTKALRKLLKAYPELGISPGLDRSVWAQGGFQLAAVLTTIGIAVLGGLATGLTLKCFTFGTLPVDAYYAENFLWEKERFTTPNALVTKLFVHRRTPPDIEVFEDNDQQDQDQKDVYDDNDSLIVKVDMDGYGEFRTSFEEPHHETRMSGPVENN